MCVAPLEAQPSQEARRCEPGFAPLMPPIPRPAAPWAPGLGARPVPCGLRADRPKPKQASFVRLAGTGLDSTGFSSTPPLPSRPPPPKRLTGSQSHRSAESPDAGWAQLTHSARDVHRAAPATASIRKAVKSHVALRVKRGFSGVAGGTNACSAKGAGAVAPLVSLCCISADSPSRLPLPASAPAACGQTPGSTSATGSAAVKFSAARSCSAGAAPPCRPPALPAAGPPRRPLPPLALPWATPASNAPPPLLPLPGAGAAGAAGGSSCAAGTTTCTCWAAARGLRWWSS
mmetsp:Transcript_62421/g.201311  ORF Transcript_62421/g.201311 Transcript_62421/m.201311 type:complete len:289 (+) Transcript_62421:125-991(+)